MTPIKKDDVYLYSRHSGRIEVYQGCVRPYIRDKARFTFKRCGKDAHLQCPLDPGVVRHNVVWLFEDDIQKAKELFIEHELMAIRDLNDKLRDMNGTLNCCRNTRNKGGRLMVCPDCGGKLTVVDMVRDEDDVYRRRKCTVCGRLVYTLESEVTPDASYRSTWNTLQNNSRNKNKEEKQ